MLFLGHAYATSINLVKKKTISKDQIKSKQVSEKIIVVIKFNNSKFKNIDRFH